MTDYYEYYTLTPAEEEVVNAPVEEEIAIDNTEFIQLDDDDLDRIMDEIKTKPWEVVNAFLEKLAEDDLNPQHLVYTGTSMEQIKKARRKQVIQSRYEYPQYNVINHQPWNNTWNGKSWNTGTWRGQTWDPDTQQWTAVDPDVGENSWSPEDTDEVG